MICTIPNPQFIVFYNGEKKAPAREELRLSSAYEVKTEDINLELKVTVLNINVGYNEEIMEQCKTLKEYALFVQKVRSMAKVEMELSVAMERAVDECIKEDILSDFLRSNRSEVIEMSVFEYDKVEEERKLRETERNAGYSKGLESGRIEAVSNMISLGIPEETILTMYSLEEYQKAKTTQK